MCKYIDCDGECDQCNMLTAMEGCKCGNYFSRYGCNDCPYKEDLEVTKSKVKEDSK